MGSIIDNVSTVGVVKSTDKVSKGLSTLDCALNKVLHNIFMHMVVHIHYQNKQMQFDFRQK